MTIGLRQFHPGTSFIDALSATYSKEHVLVYDPEQPLASFGPAPAPVNPSGLVDPRPEDDEPEYPAKSSSVGGGLGGGTGGGVFLRCRLGSVLWGHGDDEGPDPRCRGQDAVVTYAMSPRPWAKSTEALDQGERGQQNVSRAVGEGRLQPQRDLSVLLQPQAVMGERWPAEVATQPLKLVATAGRNRDACMQVEALAPSVERSVWLAAESIGFAAYPRQAVSFAACALSHDFVRSNALLNRLWLGSALSISSNRSLARVRGQKLPSRYQPVPFLERLENFGLTELGV